MKQYDSFIVVGQGLAGTLIAFELYKKGVDFKVYDEGHQGIASSVAAGLINPITGRRMVKSERIDELLPYAKQKYKELESFLGIHIWTDRNILWTLSSIKEENDWESRVGLEEVKSYIEPNIDSTEVEKVIQKGIKFGEIKNSAQVDLLKLITTFRAFLKKENLLIEEKFINKKIENQLVIYCEGEKARFNSLWNFIPFVVAKGEVLHLNFSRSKFEKIIKKNVTIIPIGGEKYWVGSNYEWNPVDNSPTGSQKKIFLDELATFVVEDFEIINHISAIRPTTKDRRPLLGFHPEHKNLAIFNGLGTKGTSLGPFWASHFIDVIFQNEKLIKEVDIQRFIKND